MILPKLGSSSWGLLQRSQTPSRPLQPGISSKCPQGRETSTSSCSRGCITAATPGDKSILLNLCCLLIASSDPADAAQEHVHDLQYRFIWPPVWALDQETLGYIRVWDCFSGSPVAHGHLLITPTVPKCSLTAPSLVQSTTLCQGLVADHAWAVPHHHQFEGCRPGSGVTPARDRGLPSHGCSPPPLVTMGL